MRGSICSFPVESQSFGEFTAAAVSAAAAAAAVSAATVAASAAVTVAYIHEIKNKNWSRELQLLLYVRVDVCSSIRSQ